MEPQVTSTVRNPLLRKTKLSKIFLWSVLMVNLILACILHQEFKSSLPSFLSNLRNRKRSTARTLSVKTLLLMKRSGVSRSIKRSNFWVLRMTENQIRYKNVETYVLCRFTPIRTRILRKESPVVGCNVNRRFGRIDQLFPCFCCRRELWLGVIR